MGLLDRSKTSGFRSGLCLALSTIPSERLPPANRKALTACLQRLYGAAPDPGTRSAALFTLRKWQRPLPPLPANSKRESMKWFVNSQGITMLRIELGQFTMGEPEKNNQLQAQPHPVRLTKPFFIADREVTVEMYLRFMNDGDYPPDKRPQAWRYDNIVSPTKEHPMQSMAWEDAILFCNWLSVMEGKTPRYERMPKAKTGKIPSNVCGQWRWNTKVDGYRLPTEAEWEYACRAGTASRYFFGPDETLLPWYGTYSSGYKIPTTLAASRMPNGWGLFDTHGNVWEWCWDSYGPFEKHLQIDPIGPVSANAVQAEIRVIRGGGVFNGSSFFRLAGDQL